MDTVSLRQNVIAVAENVKLLRTLTQAAATYDVTYPVSEFFDLILDDLEWIATRIDGPGDALAAGCRGSIPKPLDTRRPMDYSVPVGSWPTGTPRESP